MSSDAPPSLHREVVLPEWIDYNGHMNVAYYVLAFDHATDAFLDYVGIDGPFRAAQNSSTFAVEAHVTYLRELEAGAPMRFTTQLLGYDEKRMHYIHFMYHGEDGYLAATSEWLSLYMDMTARKVSPMPAAILDRLAEISAAQTDLPRPPQAGRVIALNRS